MFERKSHFCFTPHIQALSPELVSGVEWRVSLACVTFMFGDVVTGQLLSLGGGNRTVVGSYCFDL